jgi:hypothetical protein
MGKKKEKASKKAKNEPTIDRVGLDAAAASVDDNANPEGKISSNDTVSFGDISPGGDPSPSSPNHGSDVARAWRFLDEDDSGTADTGEIRSVTELFGKHSADEQFRNKLENLESQRKINVQEFKKWWRTLSHSERAHWQFQEVWLSVVGQDNNTIDAKQFRCLLVDMGNPLSSKKEMHLFNSLGAHRSSTLWLESCDIPLPVMC